MQPRNASWIRSVLDRWLAGPDRTEPRGVRRTARRGRLSLEALEDRVLFTASVTASVTNSVLTAVVADGGGDTTTLAVHRKSADSTSANFNVLEVQLNGVARSTFEFSSFNRIVLQAGVGNDTLKVDQGNGNLNLPVTFLAGTGSDTYSDTAANLGGVVSSGKVVLGDQLNTQLNNLQTLIDSNVYNQPLPVVATTGSDRLQDVGQADILGTFSTKLQKALDNSSMSNPGGLASSAGPADIQKALFATLGPSGARLLQTLPGDTNTTPGLNDVVVVANNGTFSYQMSLANQNQAYDAGTQLDFEPGLAGLPLSLSTQSQQVVQTQLGFHYDFKFNIATSAAASIDNSTTSAQPLLIGLNARLASGYEDASTTLGLLNAGITDSATNPTTLAAQYHVTFSGSGNSSTVSANVDGTAHINLHMVLSFLPNQLGPDSLTGGSNTTGDSLNLKFIADMAGTWNFGTSAAPVPLGPLTSLGSQPTISFKVSMDANSFFQNFVRPIVTDDILPEFNSVQPIADVLDYKVPLLNFGLDDVLDNAALTPVGNFRGFFQSIHKFQLLALDLASFPTVVGQVDLGSLSISQDARVKTHGPNSSDYVSIMGGDATPPTTDPLTQLRNLVSDPAHLIRDLSSQDNSLDAVGGTLQLSNDDVNFFDMINMSVQFSVGVGFKDITFNLLQFPMLSSPVNIFNMMMNHYESLLTWDTAPAALNVQNTFAIPTDKEIPGGAIELTPQISFLAHYAGGFDTHGLEIGIPNQGFYLTDADPTESDSADISSIVDQFTANPNAFHSTFLTLTVAFSVDAGFSTDAILADEGEPSISDLGTSFSIGLGITFAGHITWKLDDPDTSTLSQGLETPFSDRTLEQQVMRPDEILNEIQNCGGTIWQETGNLTFGFNFVISLKIFYIPILSKTINLISFKIADFNTPPCTGMATPPLAHLGDANNNVSGPYADANPSKEVAGTLYLNTATAQPANSADTSQDDTVIIKALANNADGTDNLLVTAQGRTQEFDDVHAIYADGGGGNDSFIVKPGVRIPAVIHDGDGNDHLEYDGSGSASLYAGNGTNSLLGGTGPNILVSGNGNSTVQDAGPGTLTVGNGDNIILGGSSSQTIAVGNGNNNIDFGSGANTITLGTGANTITGSIKGGHVKIIDPSSTDTDHTGQGLEDQLILNGTKNPDNVRFSTSTLNGSPAVQIDDGTANSTWSVTAQNINALSFNGGGNAEAIGRDGDNITVGDLSSTGVATVNVDPNHGRTPNRQNDAFTVLGTSHADNISLNASSGGVAVTGLGYTVNLSGMDPAEDTLAVNGNGGNDTLTVGNGGPTTTTTAGTTTYARPENAFSSLTLQGGAGTSSQVVVSDDADFTLSDTALSRSTGGTITLNNITQANLTGGAGVNHFHVLNWSGTANLDGAGNSDTYQIDFQGSGSGIVNVTDTGSGPPASNRDSLTVNGTAGSDTVVIGSARIARGTEQVNYSGVENVTVNGALSQPATAADTFNVTSTSVPTTVNAVSIAGGGSNVINVGSRAPMAGGIVDNIKGALSVVGAGSDTLNVDDTGSTVAKAGTLTATTLTGLNMGTGGISYSGLSKLNINLGAGGATGNTFSITVAAGQNLPATTTINGGASNKDSVNATWAQDFNGSLSLLAFEKTTIAIGRDFNGTLSAGNIQQMTIGHALGRAGTLSAASIVSLSIGPDMVTPGDDMAGRLIVAGTLGDLRVAGGTPGTVVAGQVGTVRVYSGYGPVVLQINEAGIQRRVEAAVPGSDYPIPLPPPVATPPISPAGVTFQYYYESGSLANPQLTARVSNSSPHVDQFDVSLVTYNDAAKFNLARLDAAGASGIRNVAVEGDLLTAVTAGAAGFFKLSATRLDTTPAGVRLGLDPLAGVALRDYAPNGDIQAKSIQAIAFGSHTRSDGKIETGTVAQAGDAARLLAAGTAIVQANDTFRVPFADLPAYQVGFFLATGSGKFDNQNIALVVQALTTPNATLTANIVTPQNVARGADTALIKAVPTYDKKGKIQDSVVQTIDFRGDGASMVSGQYIAGGITSTGPLGDILFKSGPINNVTAPSIFGSIGPSGPIVGTIQTTGQRTDPITGVVTSVPADLGRLFVTMIDKCPHEVTTTVTSTAGLSGQLIVRGNLISQVQVNGGLSGLVAVQGNIAETTVKDKNGHTVRLGGLVVNGGITGQVVVLGTVYADVIVHGGLQQGRIAVKGDILGNLTIDGSLDAASAVIAGGKIGDATAGTVMKVGDVKGILAAEGSIAFDHTPNTKQAAFFGSNLKTQNSLSAAAIDSLFANNGNPVIFGLDLTGLGLIRKQLAALHVSNGKLA
jgi:hypothetical protein